MAGAAKAARCHQAAVVVVDVAVVERPEDVESSVDAEWLGVAEEAVAACCLGRLWAVRPPQLRFHWRWMMTTQARQILVSIERV